MTPTSPRSQDEEPLSRALSAKREQLDKEVAAFRTQKEKEYQEFEAKLKQDVASGRSVAEVVGQKGEMHDSAQTESAVSTGIVRLAHAKPSPQSTSQAKAPMPPTPTDERDLEVRSLFTPTYLPLLEDTPARGRGRKSASSAPNSQGSNKGSSLLSSSLTLPSLAYTPEDSHARAPSLPGSLQRPSLGDHRSSSNSSVTSPGLRSSLRQPRSPQQEAAKGRKHVLFSINNMVISPSSSPLAKRQTSAGKPPTPLSTTQDPLLEDTSDYFHNNFHRIPVPSADTVTTPRSPIARSYQELVEPTVAAPPASAGDEADFAANAGSDPLFEFDEEVGPVGDGESDEAISRDDSEDEPPSGTQSPHVGSLPIEIKWPGRIGGR